MKHIVLLLSIFLYQSVHAQNDTIILSNTDRIIGEIKQMDRGVLVIETPYSDSDFYVEWVEVKEIYMNQNGIITLEDGDRHFGMIHSDPDSVNTVKIREDFMSVFTTIEDIVYIKCVKDDFLSRLKANIDVGLSYTKANNLTQFSTRSAVGYFANKWSLQGSINVVYSQQDSIDPTQRSDANVTGMIFLPKDYFVSLTGDFLQNDEQKLKLRSNARSGFGRYMIHTNQMYFGGVVGLAINNERYTIPDEPDRLSLESFVGLELNFFDFGDLSLKLKASIFPSLTESGRVRSDTSFDIKYDLPRDFYVKFGITHNYDNKPIESGSVVDYVMQTTFGWEL